MGGGCILLLDPSRRGCPNTWGPRAASLPTGRLAHCLPGRAAAATLCECVNEGTNERTPETGINGGWRCAPPRSCSSLERGGMLEKVLVTFTFLGGTCLPGKKPFKSLSLTSQLCSLWGLLGLHDPSLGRGHLQNPASLGTGPWPAHVEGAEVPAGAECSGGPGVEPV